jgi:hypothetical protein
MNEYKNLGNIGWYRDNKNLITFQLGETTPLADATPGLIDISQFQTVMQPVVLNVQDKYILIKGVNNRLPEEITSVIGTNRILPELIEKQTRMLYGKGPRVYIEDFKNGKLVRNWQKQSIIETWLDSWQDFGLQDNPKDFCEKVIHDYYYFEDYWIKWRFFGSRRLSPKGSVAGLEHIENKRCRLATDKNLNELWWDIEDKDFNNVVIGNWMVAMEKRFNVYNRFRISNPNGNSVAISYHKNHTVGQIYGFNRFYMGIKDWLTGTNRNPRYINSYLENSLNAKVHVIIPYQWVENIEKKLQDYCDENSKRQDAGKELIKPHGIEIGTDYSTTFRDQYIARELETLSSFLSGVSNQGKLYSTFSYPTSEGKEVSWQIIPLDLKYREFITALIDYDKRADEVILSSIGIDASISNISKDGVISKSGSDLYYNYVIYLYNLALAEETCTEAINQAIKINFPEFYLQGYRVGFYNEVPQRQEDISPQDRLQNSFNRSVESINNQVNKINDRISKIEKEITK